jgi:hypothetical protein
VRMWMMPPSKAAPMIVRQPTSVSHLGSCGMDPYRHTTRWIGGSGLTGRPSCTAAA